MRYDGDLSDRQESIMRVTRSWIVEHGQAPTIRQISERVDLSSTSSVAYQLGRLGNWGLVTRTGRGGKTCHLGSPTPSRRSLRCR